MDDPSTTPYEKPSIFAGVAWIVLGLLVFVPSGLCTGFLAFSAMKGPAASNFMSVPLLIGGPFVIGGAVMILFGLRELVAYSRKADKG